MQAAYAGDNAANAEFIDHAIITSYVRTARSISRSPPGPLSDLILAPSSNSGCQIWGNLKKLFDCHQTGTKISKLHFRIPHRHCHIVAKEDGEQINQTRLQDQAKTIIRQERDGVNRDGN